MFVYYMSLMELEDDRDKFEKIYIEYRNLMFFVANRVLNNSEDAEDAVHDAFIKIAKIISKIEKAVSPKTKALVIVIAEHTAIELYRRRRYTDDIDDMVNTLGVSCDIDNGTLIAFCMAKLPIRYRQILLLKYAYGFSNKEAAQIMDITETNAIKLDQRAKRKLREVCEEEEVIL